MDKLEKHRAAIKQVLQKYAALPRRNMESETVFDDAANRYLLVVQGWQGAKRIYYCAAHLEIINDKIWIQRDGTEDGLARELEKNGIPKNEIVLGFHEPEARPFTEYSAA
jgi:hypothetical protein